VQQRDRPRVTHIRVQVGIQQDQSFRGSWHGGERVWENFKVVSPLPPWQRKFARASSPRSQTPSGNSLDPRETPFRAIIFPLVPRVPLGTPLSRDFVARALIPLNSLSFLAAQEI
jgi:hypothetical protein